MALRIDNLGAFHTTTARMKRPFVKTRLKLVYVPVPPNSHSERKTRFLYLGEDLPRFGHLFARHPSKKHDN